MASVDKKQRKSIVDEWLTEDSLMLLTAWSRDGYTYVDIANKIGVGNTTLRQWRDAYPEIDNALKTGREIVDYKVENALLKSALGYKTKEVKVTTLMRRGQVIETLNEVTERDQAPNAVSCQVWLYNRLPDKWKRNRDSIINLDEEDASIQVTVTRADSKSNPDNEKKMPEELKTDTEDKEWQDEINSSITITKKKEETEENNKKTKGKKKSKKKEKANSKLKKEAETNDRDSWPDDWNEEE